MEIFCDSSLYTSALSTPANAARDDNYKPKDDTNGRAAKEQVRNSFSQLTTPSGKPNLGFSAHNTKDRTARLLLSVSGGKT